MRIRWSTVFGGLFGFLVIQGESRAAFDVTSWNLTTGLLQFGGDGVITDSDDILTVSNPLNQTAHAHIGSNFADATYDYSWLRAYGTGEFRTGITHAIRSPEVRTVSSGQIFILPTEDIRVTIDAMLNYSHTPGDDSFVSIGFAIRNITSSQYLYEEVRIGGNLYLLPASGTLAINRTDILTAGSVYRLEYGVTGENIADQLPTGILNANGFVNFSIAPVVPEPTTLALLALAAAVLSRRRRTLRRKWR